MSLGQKKRKSSHPRKKIPLGILYIYMRAAFLLTLCFLPSLYNVGTPSIYEDAHIVKRSTSFWVALR